MFFISSSVCLWLSVFKVLWGWGDKLILRCIVILFWKIMSQEFKTEFLRLWMSALVLKDGTRQCKTSWSNIVRKLTTSKVEKGGKVMFLLAFFYMTLFFKPQQACKAESKDYCEMLILVCLDWKLLKTGWDKPAAPLNSGTFRQWMSAEAGGQRTGGRTDTDWCLCSSFFSKLQSEFSMSGISLFLLMF